MFKCKECGTEYSIKPDFCDCGNDTFDEIEVLKQDTVITPNIPAEKEFPTSDKPDFSTTKNKQDTLSIVIFLFCIILAIIILFFVGNPKQGFEDIQSPTEKPKQTVNIPAIDTFWNNSTIGIINNEKSMPNRSVHARSAINQPQQQTSSQLPVAPQTIPKTKIMQNPIKQQSLSTVKNQSIPKQIITNSQTKQISSAKPKTQNTTAQTPVIPKNTQAIANGQTTNTNTAKTTSPQAQSVQPNVKKTPATQHNPVQNSQNSTVASIQGSTTLRPKTQIDTQALKKELNNYKIGLRNTIGRKIDFAKVIGDGECTVSFKVASNGKLTNRTFTKQSSNITLNDAVYSAIMDTPSYNPPPTGYKNEAMSLHIKFYNGNFDISLN